MGMHMKRSIILMLLLVFTASPSAQEAAQPTANQAERFVTIDFNNVDIAVFIKFISELTGKNFIVDPRVKGQVTIISPGRISVEEAYKVFESVLDVHGFAAVQSGEVIKILPSPEARTKNVEILQEAALAPEDKIITQLIPLKYADPEDIRKLFAPLVSRSSVVLAYTPTNTLIITLLNSGFSACTHSTALRTYRR